MNVVVCVKQIPDPAVPGALSADHTLDRSGKLILDESDSYGVESREVVVREPERLERAEGTGGEAVATGLDAREARLVYAHH